MSALANQRHERFAQELVIGLKTGRTQAMSYRAAGYRANDDSAEAAASRLLGNVRNGIAERVKELVCGGAKRAEVTVASLLSELEDARAGATSVEQFGAATSAILAKSKIAGVGAPDRVEVGTPGSFSMDRTIDEMINQFGDGNPSIALASFDETMAELRAELLERAAAFAKIVDAPSPRPSDEAARALELLLPLKRNGRR